MILSGARPPEAAERPLGGQRAKASVGVSCQRCALMKPTSASSSSSASGIGGITFGKPLMSRDCGLRMNSRRKASSTWTVPPPSRLSRLPNRPFQVGPTLGLPSVEWQPRQALDWAS
jgi:hypothetical protein